MNAVSLFSNCGAGDVGYSRAGFRFKVMAELDPRRLEIALLNHPDAQGIPGDLRETWPEVVRQFKVVDANPPILLAACPPCQGMSSARGDRGRESDADSGSRDSRNLLVMPIAAVADALKPTVIVVENVPAFLTRQVRDPRTGLASSAAAILIDALLSEYECYPFVDDLYRYTIPQTRRRTLLTFVRRGQSAIGWLAAQGRMPYPVPRAEAGLHASDLGNALMRMGLSSLDSAAAETASIGSEPLHRVPVLPKRLHDMVHNISPGSAGSAWSNNVCSSCDAVGQEEDIVCPSCLRPLPKPIVVGDKGPRLIHGFRNSSYRRMDPNRPAATITTASGRVGSDLTLHPYEDRVLSPLECALLQTIPLSFEWGDALDAQGHTRVRAMIGEAVPPRFTYLHGRAIVDALSCGRPHRIAGIDSATHRRALVKLTGQGPLSRNELWLEGPRRQGLRHRSARRGTKSSAEASHTSTVRS